MIQRVIVIATDTTSGITSTDFHRRLHGAAATFSTSVRIPEAPKMEAFWFVPREKKYWLPRYERFKKRSRR